MGITPTDLLAHLQASHNVRVQYALQLVHVAVLVCCHKAVPAEPVEQPEDSCS
jgi:hypothetical protein